MSEITVNELKDRLSKGEDLKIIDVREPYEYEEFNIGALNIPLGDLQSKIDDLDEWMNEEVIVHCKSGARSAAAKAFLDQNGFKNVRNLVGGMMAYQSM